MNNEELILQRLDSLHDGQQRIERVLTGGDDPAKGLILKVDRLEQSHAQASKTLWIAVTAAIGTAGQAIWQLLSRGQHS